MSQPRRTRLRQYRFYRRCPRPSIYRFEIFVAASNHVATWAEGQVEAFAADQCPESTRQLFERISREEAIVEGVHEARNANWLIGGLYLGEHFEDQGQSEEELVELSAAATEQLVDDLSRARQTREQGEDWPALPAHYVRTHALSRKVGL